MDAASESTPSRLLAWTSDLGFDAIIITAATKDNTPFLLAAAVARDRARIVLVGDVRIDIPRGPLYEKELSILLSRSYGPGRYDPQYEEHGHDYPIGYVRWTEQRNMAAFLEMVAAGECPAGSPDDASLRCRGRTEGVRTAGDRIRTVLRHTASVSEAGGRLTGRTRGQWRRQWPAWGRADWGGQLRESCSRACAEGLGPADARFGSVRPWSVRS